MLVLTSSLIVAMTSSMTSAQESGTVANEWYEVEIERVEQVDSLHGGMLLPEDPEDAFLLVYLHTEDPCFDPATNQDCFEAEFDEFERVAWACGEVLLGEETVPADGGGVTDDSLVCSFVVPAGTADLTLVLRGYPEVELSPRK